MTAASHTNDSHSNDRWNTVFKAVAAEPRRQIIVSLLDAPPDGTVPLPEGAYNPNTATDLETLRQELYHAHLPMLSEMEFVESESDPLVASRGPRFKEVAAVFEALHAEQTEVPDPLVVSQQLDSERGDVQ